ncbi:MAG: rhodanese-like domain-containing protein [Bacteroidota bacterium]|nr:rhodanese-like domain-containing protein [Bacteroidota bacterium]
MKIKPVLLLAIVSIILSGLNSCNNQTSESSEKDTSIVETIDAFPLLMRHLERENDYINNQAPSVILASDVYAELGKNIHIIDIREKEEYAEGHIKGAVNLNQKDILDYLLNDIVPSNFDKIIIVCENGDASTYVSSVLSLIGYFNIFALKYGMCSWNKDFAKDYWLSAIKKDYSAKLVSKTDSMPEKGEYPKLPSCEMTCADAMEKMAKDLLDENPSQLKISIDELLAKPDDYFIISYLPEKKYKAGHIPGSVHYAPRASLRRDSALNTLPLDKTIVLYCYSGHHTAAVTAYLNLLGYTAKNLEYGSMGFMNKQMKEKGEKHFSSKKIMNYPFSVGSSQ